MWDARTGQELCSLVSLDAGKDWLVVTPDGLWDGSAGARRFLAYRVAGALDFVPLERAAERYHSPGLFGKLMAGEQPKDK